jgi:hypothetical protein
MPATYTILPRWNTGLPMQWSTDGHTEKPGSEIGCLLEQLNQQIVAAGQDCESSHLTSDGRRNVAIEVF